VVVGQAVEPHIKIQTEVLGQVVEQVVIAEGLFHLRQQAIVIQSVGAGALVQQELMVMLVDRHLLVQLYSARMVEMGVE
jgi:hypothetical protein